MPSRTEIAIERAGFTSTARREPRHLAPSSCSTCVFRIFKWASDVAATDPHEIDDRPKSVMCDSAFCTTE